MENAPTPLFSPSPPSPAFPFPAPPRAVNQITVIATLPPPSPPQPPFPDTPSSVDLSPLEFLLALVAVVTIPALIYTFIFAVKCPSRRRRRQIEETSGGLSSVAVSESASHDGDAAAPAVVFDLKYQKDAHVKEIGSECPVCLSVFGDGEEIRQLSACKHSFHSSCIDMWLSNHSNCPICRATIAVKRPAAANTAAPARDSDLQQGLPDASALV